MKGLVVCLAVSAIFTCVTCDFTNGFKVKFNYGLSPSAGTDFFFNVARNKLDAIADGWLLTKRLAGPLPILVMYCPEEYHLCALYDNQTNYIAGLQISLPKDEFVNTPYNLTVQGFRDWTPLEDGVEYWSTTQFFVSEEHLSKTVEERIASRTSDKVLQENAIWLTGFNGALDKFPEQRSDIEQTIFTKQACFPWMGRHFYYNMTSDTLCKEDTMYPWFLLVAAGRMVGSAIAVPGQLPVKEGRRDWFERPPKAAVQIIVNNGPKCLYEQAGTYGILTMHIYYIEEPHKLINCITN